MPFLDTTRTGTVYFEFTTAWDFTVHIFNLFPLTVKYGRVNGNVGGHGGFAGYWEIDWTSTPLSGGTWTYQVFVILTVDNGHGTPVTTTTNIASATVPAATQFINLSGTLNGVFSASVGTDVLWDITSGSSINTTTGEVTHPPITSYRLYERSRVGTSALATMSLGAASASVTTVVTAGNRVTMNYIIGTYQDAYASDTASASCNVMVHLCNGLDPYQETHTHTHGGNSCTNWSTNVSASSYPDDGYVLLNSLGRLPAKVQMDVVTRAWKDAYPDSLDYTITGFDYEVLPLRNRAVSGAGGFSAVDDIYYFYIASEIYDGSTSSYKTTERDGIPITISAEIQTASLLTRNDDTQDKRIMFRSWEFNGAHIQLTNPYSIAGTGNTRTYSPLQGTSSYRWLKVQIKCQSGTNQAGQIEITDFHGYTKRWDVVAATTTYEVVTIDLCMPDEWSVTGLPLFDIQNTPYPRKNTVSADYAGAESIDGPYWGVTSMSQLRVSSGAIDIGTTELDKITHAHQNFLPSGKRWKTERITPDIVATNPNLTETFYYARRFWQLEQDGRTEEESDIHFQNTVTPVVSTWAAQVLSISDLCTQILATDDGIIRHPGFNATNSVAYPGAGTCSVTQPPLRDCYLNGETGLATWLHGGGAIARKKPGGGGGGAAGHDWHYGFDHNGGSIKAQALYDSIAGDFIPDYDDPFDLHNGGTPHVLYMKGASFLRLPAHGITYDVDGDIATSGTVSTIHTFDGSSGGNDSTFTSEGVYETGTPYVLGNKNYTVTYFGFSTTTLLAYTSLRQRVVWRFSEEGERDLSADVHSSLLKFYADVISGNIHIHFSYSYNPGSWNDVDTGIASDGGFEVRWTYTDQARRLDIIYANSGTTYHRYSDNEGASFSVATTIMTGTKPTACVGPNGMEFIFARTAGGGINCVVRDPLGNVIQASHSVVASGVADDSIAAFVRDTTVYLFYRNAAASVIVLTSTDNGNLFI